MVWRIWVCNMKYMLLVIDRKMRNRSDINSWVRKNCIYYKYEFKNVIMVVCFMVLFVLICVYN